MNKLNVLIIGSGGREHALAWKIAQSSMLGELYVAPGNVGTGDVADNIELDIADHDEIVKICKLKHIDLVVIGPDDVLAAGLADVLRESDILVFGPDKAAARIESSKSFAKDVMRKSSVSTASYEEFTDFAKAVDYLDSAKFPLVVKADGLALGKGVVVCQTRDEAQVALKNAMQDKVFGEAGSKVIIEEFLDGAEVSLHGLSDGANYVMLPSAQDHKPISEGDIGPNTGGMGTIAPVPWMSRDDVDDLGKKVIEPILKHLENQNEVFVGCLYPSVMVQKDGYGIIEYNARFGDPETQSYMRLLESDLLELLLACAKGDVSQAVPKWSDKYACCIVLASAGYPGSYEKGTEITGLDELAQDIVVFHAGTKREGGKLVTNGGRVLGITATGSTLQEALDKAYVAADKIHFDGKQYRRDIGQRPQPDWL